jgi:hypothetical protein
MKILVSLASSVVAFFSIITTGVMVFALFAFLTGCGSMKVPKTEVVEDAGECGKKRTCTAEAEKPAEETAEVATEKPAEGKPAGDKSGVNVSVDVRVTVEVIAEDDEIDAPSARFLFVAKAKTWEAHRLAAPKGYRMVSRAEAIDALEKDELKNIIDKDEIVWTSSESKQVPEMAWLVGEYNNFEAMKTLAFPALYIAE